MKFQTELSSVDRQCVFFRPCVGMCKRAHIFKKNYCCVYSMRLARWVLYARLLTGSLNESRIDQKDKKKKKMHSYHE